MPTYTMQESAALKTIAPDLIQAQVLDDPIFKKFPISEQRQFLLRWLILDNFRGLMNLRGLDGAPTRVLRPGENLYESQPGTFGEFGEIGEQELTTRAAAFAGALDIPVDVSDIVREWQKVLTTRQAQRMIQMAWTLAVTHTLQLLLPQGGVGLSESFPGQTMTVATLWSSVLTATPLNDLASLQFTYGRGTSNDYQGGAEAWMNGRTARYLMNNRNANDLGGIRAKFGETIFNSIEGFNAILLDQGAPKIMIYEGSYQADTPAGAALVNNNYQMYLPDGVVWVCAARPGGELPGQFQWTMNAVDMDTKPYAEVMDYTKAEQGRKAIPPRIEVHQGFNGGPVQTRPSQTVTMLVA